MPWIEEKGEHKFPGLESGEKDYLPKIEGSQESFDAEALKDIELGQYYQVGSIAEQDKFIRFRESQLWLD